ncbi:MAG TPA: hypothetical protein VK506_16275 [Conexibacter sp.]|nr:hypothetical protein [Conexibacter sp.]
MAKKRWTFEQAMDYGIAMRRVDRYGRPIPTRAEWEQLGRWRRWRDLLLGWQPPKNDVLGIRQQEALERLRAANREPSGYEPAPPASPPPGRSV